MVYFNCAKCGTGLRKNQVEPHMNQCRSKAVSCIDCQKDFVGEEFKVHTVCLTESERYESKSSFVKKMNKGDQKQSAWLQNISKAVETFKGSNNAKILLEKLIDYPNVPRKRAKFNNFVRNSFRAFRISDAQLDELWTVIESFDVKTKQQEMMSKTQANNNAHSNIVNHNEQNGSLKRKLDETDLNNNNNNNIIISSKEADVSDTFEWLHLVKNQCVKNENQQIELNKLAKKLYKKYLKHKAMHREEVESSEISSAESEEAMQKFHKKLMKKLKKNSELFNLSARSCNADEISDENKTFVRFIGSTD